jgi:hypothetical protein
LITRAIRRINGVRRSNSTVVARMSSARHATSIARLSRSEPRAVVERSLPSMVLALMCVL